MQLRWLFEEQDLQSSMQHRWLFEDQDGPEGTGKEAKTEECEDCREGSDAGFPAFAGYYTSRTFSERSGGTLESPDPLYYSL